MSGYNNFVTQSSIDAKNEERREARKLILEKAKRKYEADERREKKKKESGEGTWMLDTVSKRIHKEEKNLEDAKSKSKKKKKKKKKKKHHKKHSDSSSSSSEGDSDEEGSWVESKPAGGSNASNPSAGKPLQRDSWMEAPIDLLPMTSRQEIRDAANKEKEKAKMEAEKHLQPGQHARELNPYWKNGGTGLPSARPASTDSAKPLGAAGDGGLSWLLKSLSRIKEQAQEEGRSVEDIAAERYGSLDRLMSMIRDAEKSQGRGREGERRDRQSDGRRDFRDRDKDRRRESDRSYEDRSKDRLPERKSSRERDSYRHRERRRSRSSEREDRADDHGRDQNKDGRRDQGGRLAGFRRPQSDDEGNEDHHRKTDKESLPPSGDSRRRMFKRPGDDDDDEDRGKSRDDRSMDRSRHRSDRDDARSRHDERGGRTGWRKSPPRKEDDGPRWKKRDTESSKESQKVERKKERSRKKSSSSSSSSSSEDEGQRSQSTNQKTVEGEGSDEDVPVPAAPKVMTEEELNDLAAKVLRAEIMGDEALASQLKSTLEEARRVREASKAQGGGEGGGGGGADFVHSKRKERERQKEREEEEEEDNVVVLSRTNKAGMTRPVLPSASEEWGRSAGKKRKRKNVATHDESGERTKFFHDDDQFDLKTLVEREKAGTAEDQNSMFARLAGRETDRDMDMDDMFVSKAAKNQQEEEAVNRDKMAAIMEHRKKSSAMEKCMRCFDKVHKHLIVAIGRKSYLCLPEHASLTEGHCFIVPMAHSTSATSLDEDVWQDMQLFRKSLVQMFLEQDKDLVVMETVMRLKYFPHTAIECIPLEREVGDLAPIYFKKAIQEAGPEWSHNKKIHDLSKKDIRHTIPKGFPYFSVDFGLQGGFAHVIEDEATFPSYFGREIVGGMLDVEPSLWRKPRKQNFEDQRQKMLQFEQWWSPFDWTQNLG